MSSAQGSRPMTTKSTMIRDTAAAQERIWPVCNACESHAQVVSAGVYTEPSNSPNSTPSAAIAASTSSSESTLAKGRPGA